MFKASKETAGSMSQCNKKLWRAFLPETLEVHKSREWIVMNLEAEKEFFGILVNGESSGGWVAPCMGA